VPPPPLSSPSAPSSGGLHHRPRVPGYAPPPVPRPPGPLVLAADAVRLAAEEERIRGTSLAASRRALTLVQAQPCPARHAPAGAPCYALPSTTARSGGRAAWGLCGQRIEAVFGPPPPPAPPGVAPPPAAPRFSGGHGLRRALGLDQGGAR
jgi:hypothetical protein